MLRRVDKHTEIGKGHHTILPKERARMFKFAVAVFSLFLLTPSMSSAQEERLVAVLPFTGSAYEALSLGELPRELTEAVQHEINLLPGWRASISQYTAEQLQEEFGCRDLRGETECAVRIALRLNSGYLVYGRIQNASSREGETNPRLIVSLDLFEAAGQELYATAVEHSPSLSMLRHEDDLNAFIHALVRELMENVTQSDARHGRSVQLASSDVRESRAGETRPSRDARLSPGDHGYRPSVFGYLGWGATGLTIVSAAFMIGSMVYVNSLGDDAVYNAYRASVPVAMDGNHLNVCQEARAGNAWGASDQELSHARSTCDQGETWETAQYVALGGTIVFGLTAVVLHIIDLTTGQGGSRDTPRLTLSIGPDHGYVSLAGTF